MSRARLRQLGTAFVLLLTFVYAGLAQARLPQAYGALLVSAPPAETVRVFDLRPAIQAAAARGRPILLYFGAHDCPFCRTLEREFAGFAPKIAGRLRDKYTLIEIEGWLRGARMEFDLPDRRYTFAELRRLIGDQEPQFLWPSWYQLDANLTMVRELPRGISSYRSVEDIETVFDL